MITMKIPRKYKSLSHAIKLIYKQEGLQGFFKGYCTTAVLIPLNYLIYFDVYERTKQIMRIYVKDENSFLNFAVPSVVSGLVSSSVLCPLWVFYLRQINSC